MVVMGMIYNVKFHQKFHIIPMVMNLWLQKSFFVYKFSLPPNTTPPNANALEWILWIKWDDWSWTSIAIKVARIFFNQNYSSFSFLLVYYHLSNGPFRFFIFKFSKKNIFFKLVRSLYYKLKENGSFPTMVE